MTVAVRTPITPHNEVQAALANALNAVGFIACVEQLEETRRPNWRIDIAVMVPAGEPNQFFHFDPKVAVEVWADKQRRSRAAKRSAKLEERGWHVVNVYADAFDLDAEVARIAAVVHERLQTTHRQQIDRHIAWLEETAYATEQEAERQYQCQLLEAAEKYRRRCALAQAKQNRAAQLRVMFPQA